MPIDPPGPGILRLDASDDAAGTLAWDGGTVAVLSRRSPAKEERNEDAALAGPIGPGGLLLAVADGCGGMPAGDEASRRALEVLRATCLERSGEDPAGTILAGFDAANRAVLDLRAGAGTTLVAVLVRDGTARSFHVGDSVALVVGQRGAVRFEATAHSPTGRGVEAGLLSEAEAIAHADRNLVLNVLGSPAMSVDVGPPVPLRPRDTVLLASDGLTDNLPVADIVDLVRTGPCAAAVDRLAAAASARMGEPDGHADDLTLVAYRPTARRDARGD